MQDIVGHDWRLPRDARWSTSLSVSWPDTENSSVTCFIGVVMVSLLESGLDGVEVGAAKSVNW